MRKERTHFRLCLFGSWDDFEPLILPASTSPVLGLQAYPNSPNSCVFESQTQDLEHARQQLHQLSSSQPDFALWNACSVNDLIPESGPQTPEAQVLTSPLG